VLLEEAADLEELPVDGLDALLRVLFFAVDPLDQALLDLALLGRVDLADALLDIVEKGRGPTLGSAFAFMGPPSRLDGRRRGLALAVEMVDEDQDAGGMPCSNSTPIS